MCRRVYACATPKSDERLVWIIRGVTGWGVPEPGVLSAMHRLPWALVPKPVSRALRTFVRGSVFHGSLVRVVHLVLPLWALSNLESQASVWAPDAP